MITTAEIGNDILDSRDVIERIDALIEDKELEILTDNEAAELEALEALRDELQSYCPDWQYGEALILESYFTEYAEQLAEDIGAIDTRNTTWPGRHIDWKAAAEELKQDYTCAEIRYNGSTYTYWARC